ncbi:MAG: HYR domain-containing protein, partial [Planctomycetes bacterium]|nr:HYR domain-containing protein [Planctomycetota bacterium]
DITVSNDTGVCGATVNFADATATDNCTVTVSQTAGLASGSVFPVGTSMVTFSATDGVNAPVTCTFMVTVTDDEAPVITCPLDITVSNDTGVCGATVNFADATATDNCTATVSQTAGLTSGSVFPVGTSMVTFSATDGVNPAVTCTFSVTVTDDEAPMITCPADVTVTATMGMCSATATFADAMATDNCPGVTVAQTAGAVSGSSFTAGMTTVTFTATDAAGNMASCNMTVTVIGDAPIITMQPMSQTVCENGSATFSVAATGTPPLTYQWRFGGMPIMGATGASYTVNPVTLADDGSYDVIVSNNCGSATSGSATLTVETVPMISMDPASQAVCENGPVTFAVVATGGSLSYQWRLDGTPLPGETNATLVIGMAQVADAGSYDVVVTNSCGSATSAAATLTVLVLVGNDPCDAINLTGSTVIAGDTTCASPQAVLSPSCGAGTGLSNDQWYTFTPTCNGTIVLSTCSLSSSGSTTFESHLAVWSGPDAMSLGCPFSSGSGTFTEVGCAEATPGCAGGADLTVAVVVGTTYYIRVAGSDALESGSYVLDFQYSESLTLDIDFGVSGNGSMMFRNFCGNPGDIFFTAFSFDPSNGGPMAGTGFWQGMFISPQDLESQFRKGAPYVGFLNAMGESNYVYPGFVPSIGLDLYGVTISIDPVTFTITGVSQVEVSDVLNY